jgi:Phospholipase_D-nuclease N-terminal/Short C-terminal domain
VPLADNYPFLDVLWTIFIFFIWVAWIFLLFRIIFDVFRRHDISGGKKALWMIFIIFLPFIGVLVYLIVNGGKMTERDVEHARASQAQFDDYVRQTAGSGGSAAEIARAKELLDRGAITQAEFEQLKQKALT